MILAKKGIFSIPGNNFIILGPNGWNDTIMRFMGGLILFPRNASEEKTQNRISADERMIGPIMFSHQKKNIGTSRFSTDWC